MASREYRPEEIIGKLREAENVTSQGGTMADACRRIGVTEQTYFRWLKEYGGLKMDQARRMKELEQENARLLGNAGWQVNHNRWSGSGGARV